MKAHWLTVQMASGEYGSKVSMRQLAAEQFDLHPECENLVVNVVEHAGWFLAYAMIDGQLTVVDTANDAARLTPAAYQFWARLERADADWIHLPRIERIPAEWFANSI